MKYKMHQLSGSVCAGAFSHESRGCTGRKAKKKKRKIEAKREREGKGVVLN